LWGGAVGIKATALHGFAMAGEVSVDEDPGGDLGVFGDFAPVLGVNDPFIQDAAEFFQDGLVVWVLGEVMDFVGIVLEVVEFFGGAEGSGEAGLGGGEFSAGVEDFDEGPGGILALLVEVGVQVGQVGEEIADVFVAVATDTADAVVGFVAAVSGGEDVFSFLGIGAPEDMALEMGGRIDADHFQAGGGEVDHADEVIDDGGGFEAAGPADDEGDVDTAFVEELLAADVGAAVVAEEENDGVVGESVVCEPLENFADFFIEDLGGFEIIGPVPADERMIGVVGGQADLTVMSGSDRCNSRGWSGRLLMVSRKVLHGTKQLNESLKPHST